MNPIRLVEWNMKLLKNEKGKVMIQPRWYLTAAFDRPDDDLRAQLFVSFAAFFTF